MIQMHLATGETIALQEFGHEHLVVTCANLQEFREVEDKIRAAGALDAVEITDNGETIASITGLQAAGTQTVANLDGTLTGHFYMRGGVYDLDGGEYAQAGRILLGES